MCSKACCKPDPCCQPDPCCNPCNPCCDPCCDVPKMTDCLATQIECIWKKSFCDAALLPKIGFPSCGNGVMTLTHRIDQCAPRIRINGLTSKSILVNNSFYSAEVSGCKWLNIYTISLPNVPGQCGCKSSAEVYTEALIKMGISIGSMTNLINGACPDTLSITSMAIGMNPCKFSQKQINAIKCVLKYIRCKSCDTCCE